MKKGARRSRPRFPPSSLGHLDDVDGVLHVLDRNPEAFRILCDLSKLPQEVILPQQRRQNAKPLVLLPRLPEPPKRSDKV